MAGSRKPNPTHITRYESEWFDAHCPPGTKPQRSSHYDHGIVVPAEYLNDIQMHGQVRIKETHAEIWGRRIDEYEARGEDGWSDGYRARVEHMAGDTGPAKVQTWTVGHIVWPGKEDETCIDCPYGAGTVAYIQSGETVVPADVLDDLRGSE